MINGRPLYDCFPFFNELDLLKVRAAYLHPVTDAFIPVEATTDHRGNYNQPLLTNAAGGLRRAVMGIAKINPWTTVLPEGESNWKRVWAHRNAILDALNYHTIDAPDDALVLLSDLDEIPHIDAVREAANLFTSGTLHDCCVVRFKHQNFYYNTQTTSPYLWDGTVLTTARQLRLRSPQCVRYQTADVTMDGVAGWHFSYFGGVETVQQKMKAIAEGWTGQDAFTDKERIEKVIAAGKDLYGREGETWIRLPKPPEGLPAGMEPFAGEGANFAYSVQTAHPVAADSLDHLHPVGATRDNTHCPAFAKKMAAWIKARTSGRLCMDLGCAGGGLVVDYLSAGLNAVGIEGSDKPQEEGHGHWPILAGAHLFTADIAKPFRLKFSNPLVDREDCCTVLISAFEVLEHLREEDLPAFAANIKEHLSGWFVCTINSHPWPHLTDDGRVVDHHVTQKSPEWWEAFFAGQGFVRDRELEGYIGTDWPRQGHAHFALKREGAQESAEAPIVAVADVQEAQEAKARPVASPVTDPRIDVQTVFYAEPDWEFVSRVKGTAIPETECYHWLNTVKGNEGFLSPSNNLYRQFGNAPFVCLVNSDVELKPGWDVPLLAAMLLDPNLGAVGYSGGRLTEEASCAGVGVVGRDIDYVEGWCLLLRREAVEAVALSNGLPAGTLFDDRNLDFAYCEDTDLCLRLKAGGWGLLALPNPDGQFAVHRGSETTKKVVDRGGPDAERLRKSFAANHEYMRRRWASYLKHGRVLAQKGGK